MSDWLKKLAMFALLPEADILKLVRSAPHRYKVFQIPKRKPGEFRTIAQPAREVKILQSWIVANILSDFKVHPSATAYRRGRSILQNARVHASGRFLLKMDLVDFFPSIKGRDFARYLRALPAAPFDEQSIDHLCRLLFWRPKGETLLRLSIGAPSSPIVSNLLMFDFDCTVTDLCNRHRVTYTRYADDLTFSASDSRSLQVIEREIYRLCGRLTSPRLSVNAEKTARLSKRDARRVTGLVLTNEKTVSVGRDLKRIMRAAVHHFSLGRLSVERTQWLKGMIAYLQSVEPEVVQRLEAKYGPDVLNRLRSRLPNG